MVVVVAFERLTMDEMKALCVVCYVKEKPAGNKAAHVKQLEAYHREFPRVLEDVITTYMRLPAPNTTAVSLPTTALPQA